MPMQTTLTTRIISILLFVLFALFASLQFNDPDPGLWVPIYGIPAIVCLLNAFGVYHRFTVLALMIILVIYSLSYLPSIFEWLQSPRKGEVFGAMHPDRMYIEESREFLGLLIAFFGLFYVFRTRRKR